MKLKTSEKITYIIGLHKAYYRFLTLPMTKCSKQGQLTDAQESLQQLTRLL